jgi:hypothetical protein
MNRTTRTRALTLTLAGLAGTGLFAGVASAASSGAAPASGSVPTIQTASDTTAATSGTPARANRLRIARQLATHSVHGEVVLTTKQGMQNVDFQRGAVASAGDASVTVTDASGTSETWTIDANTRVRERGQGAATPQGSAPNANSPQLSSGENVVVVGTKADGTLTARVVLIVPAAPQGGAGASGLQN